MDQHECAVRRTWGKNDERKNAKDGRCMAVSGTYRIFVGGQQPDARSAKLTGKKDLEVFLTRTGNDRQMEEE